MNCLGLLVVPTADALAPSSIIAGLVAGRRLDREQRPGPDARRELPEPGPGKRLPIPLLLLASMVLHSLQRELSLLLRITVVY